MELDTTHPRHMIQNFQEFYASMNIFEHEYFPSGSEIAHDECVGSTHYGELGIIK